MEFPHIGEHCSEPSCNRLDFLPVKCDSCSKLFCGSHMLYASHNCEAAYKKNVQVPVCPLCNQPVPSKRGELPDVSVGDHIDRDCQSDPAKKKRIYVNKCSYKGCKTKEIVKVTCGSCSLNYCLKHRHVQDHNCQQTVKTNDHRPCANSSLLRVTHEPPATSTQDYLSEDEALARAIQISLNDKKDPRSHLKSIDQDLDDDLARALAESEREYQRQQETQSKKEKCVVV